MKLLPRTRTVSVRAQGKKLSDVVPIVGVLPVVGGLVFFSARSEPDAAEMAPSAESAAVDSAGAPGLDVRAVYRSAKQAHGL